MLMNGAQNKVEIRTRHTITKNEIKINKKKNNEPKL